MTPLSGRFERVLNSANSWPNLAISSRRIVDSKWDSSLAWTATVGAGEATPAGGAVEKDGSTWAAATTVLPAAAAGVAVGATTGDALDAAVGTAVGTAAGAAVSAAEKYASINSELMPGRIIHLTQKKKKNSPKKNPSTMQM